MAIVLDERDKYLLLIIVVIIFLVVIYLELKFIRKRRGREDRSIVQDRAYNAMNTTRSIARILQREGHEVSEIFSTLREAQFAYDRKNYNVCIEIAERAKKSLNRIKSDGPKPSYPKSADCLDVPPTPSGSYPGVRTAKKIIPSKIPMERRGQDGPERTGKSFIGSVGGTGSAGQEEGIEREVATAFSRGTLGKKELPENYIQAKFMLQNSTDAIDSARRKGKDTRSAESTLQSARESFDSGEYTQTLKLALEAKRAIGAAVTVSVDSEEEGGGIVDITPEASESTYNCPECGAVINLDDKFCRKCGCKINLTFLCPKCDTELRHEDIFCGKCGVKLKE